MFAKVKRREVLYFLQLLYATLYTMDVIRFLLLEKVKKEGSTPCLRR